jgi:septal ring factor EnvC (AmiA/AmiB activator)
MDKRSFLLPAFFFFCFFVFPQEQPYGSVSVSVPPSERLRSIAANLEELERSETASLEDLKKLKKDLETLEDSLANSEAMLTELRTQADSALERYGKLWQQYEKQRKSLKAWKGVSIGSSVFTAALIVLLVLL